MSKTALASARRNFAPWNDSAAKPFIEFRNVTKRFGDFVAIDKQSFGVYEREFFAMLGPSGCGKTTLLRMLAGFETPSEGQILVDGMDIARMPPYRRPINMMFQSYALFPHMNVEQNIAFGLKQDRMPKGDIEQRVGEMLKLVQLEPFAKRKPHQLSGGQRQRVALARSLAKRPKVLLLDEPLGALDKKLRGETQFELMDIQQKLGITFLIVTHDQEEAMTVSDRIGVMDHGRMVQIATPAEIYENPKSRYIADFIGEINIIESRIADRQNGELRLISPHAQAPLQLKDDIEAEVGTTVWAAIRPEKIKISTSKPIDEAANMVEGEVWDIAYLGDLSIYHVKLESGLILKSAQTNQTRLLERPISWDDRVFLSWSSDCGVVLTQ